MARRLVALALAAAYFLGHVPDAAAQSATATLTGTVIDEMNAVVRDAAIGLVNLETGSQRTATSDERGAFVVPPLVPGNYRVTAYRDGFARAEVSALTLNVGDTLDVTLLLKIERIGASVTVTAEPARISTLPAVGTVIDRQFVANLPLNGRSFQALIAMTPGVVLTAASSTAPGQFSVNGQRSDANYFTVDGVSANVAVQPTAGLGPSGAGAAPGLSAQGGTNSLVSVDALQEFRIQTSTYAPEFGRTPGAQISIVTRSGTNQVRATAFEYFRDASLDAADYFVKRQGLAKPLEHQHDFGGVAGGPLQRDRMFVFVSYERLRLHQPRTAVTEVPSLAARLAADDFAKPILAAFSKPNGPDTANGLARFSASYTDPSTLTATSVRIDRVMGPKLTVFARYNHAPSEGSSRLGSFAIASVNTIGFVRERLQTLTGGATWIATPSRSNELRVNWSRNAGRNFQTLDGFGGAIVPPASMLHPSFAPADSVYRVNLSVPNVFFDEGSNSTNVQRQVNIIDAVTLTGARHQAKVGIDYRHLFPLYGPVSYVEAYTFNGVAGLLSGTAAGLTTAAPSPANASSHSDNFSAYAQDTWSAGSRLTLAYGVRWDLNPAPRLSHSDAALALVSADPASMALAPPGTPMYRTRYNNIAPRVGGTYRLNDSAGRETVLRGGWGIFYDIGSTSTMENLANSFPFTARRDLVNVPFPASADITAVPTVAPGSPVDFLTTADPNLRVPFTQQWNATIDQAIGSATAVTLSYVGARGHRLLRQERYLNPTPQFQTLTIGTNHAHSTYEALQAKYSRRLLRGVQALASYTLARSRDNASVDTVPALPSSRVDPQQDWGPSDFDVRHALSGGVTYVLPTPSSASPWHAVASGWSVDSIFTARSALPVNVVTGQPAFNVSNALRPDVVNDASVYVDDPALPGGRGFNRAAFTTVPVDTNRNPLRQGTLSRNALRGFAMSQVDLAVQREVRLSRAAVQLRLEAFNVFNRATFAQPTNAISSSLFGQPTRTLASGLGAGGVAGGGLNPLYQVGGPRSIQLAVKAQF